MYNAIFISNFWFLRSEKVFFKKINVFESTQDLNAKLI